MKFILNQLRKGDVVTAKIVEAVNNGEYIVSFGGDLIRVANESEQPMSVGGSIKLKVISIKPLGFQLIVRQPNQWQATV